jgi:hypothetical protein
MEELPTYINVTRVITYNVKDMQDLIYELEDEEVGLDQIIERIEDEVSEYFTGSLKDLIWTDENGNEIDN